MLELVLVLVLVLTGPRRELRWGLGRASAPASSCIADLSSCTFLHQNLLGSFCADTSSVDFQKEELNID
jgi:hypothetical protein